MPGPAVFVARVLATRLRALRTARPEARFFDGRFFTDRLVRCERDVGAMIPLTLAVPNHATAGRAESRRRRLFPLQSAHGKAD